MHGYPNLLPKAMLVRRSRHQRIRQWAAVLTLEGLLVTATGVVLRVDLEDPDAGAREAIGSTVGQINVVSSALAASQEELQAAQLRLAVATEVAGKPDWSIVLAAVATSGQGLATLDSLQLLPPMTDTETGTTSYRLTLLGVCTSRGNLTRFVQKLEETSLFSKVKIAETQRIANPEAPTMPSVGFSIEAGLVEGGA